MRNLSKEAGVTLGTAPIAAGAAGTAAGATIDMENFDSVAFLGIVGTHGSTCNVALKAQESTSSTAWADISGATISSSAGEDDKVLVLDVVRPKKRYIRSYVTRSSTAGGSELGGVLAVQYGTRYQPTTKGSSTHGATAVTKFTT